MIEGPRGLVIGAPASGTGKTLVGFGLLAALRARGLRVAGAKIGPDYIDPGFHAVAAGAACPNLDAWAMRAPTLSAVLRAIDAELVIAEGAVGLFDGIGPHGQGSSADLAASTGWPVVLVLDAGGSATSLAAIAQGFARFRDGVRVAGVIANRVGSDRHAATIRAAFAAFCPDIAFLGAQPRLDALALPSRHLGLVQARETPAIEGLAARAGAALADAIDLDRLITLAAPARLPTGAGPAFLPPLGSRIAYASDDAFSFAYPAMLSAWRARGAELIAFSPLADEAPDPSADAVYLPGGYPELHAGRISAARRFLSGLRAAAARDAFIYGECGGYMVLGEALEDADGVAHGMAGLLPLATSFATRQRALGYRSMRALTATPLGSAGAGFRGHEFHYATIRAGAGAPGLFQTFDGLGADLGPAGHVLGRTAGSFLHLIDSA